MTRTIACLCFIILLFSSLSSNSSALAIPCKPNSNSFFLPPNHSVIPPTAADVTLEQWFVHHGILSTDGVKIRTTPRSVGGRGLFYFGNDCIHRGDVLALIPSRCIFTESNAGEEYRLLRETLVECGATWPTVLTSYAQRALLLSENHNEETGSVSWSGWINSWKGGGGPGTPRNPESYSPQELLSLSQLASSSPQEVHRGLSARYQLYQQHLQQIRHVDIISEGTYISEQEQVKREEEWGELYSAVLSRTANLGPEWNYETGIIPFHDMLNHPPPPSSNANVELFTVGDVQSYTGPYEMRSLVQKAFGEQVTTSLTLGNKDMLLVAKQKIWPGDELLLDYKEGKTEWNDEKERVWLLLQYGFPLAAAGA